MCDWLVVLPDPVFDDKEEDVKHYNAENPNNTLGDKTPKALVPYGKFKPSQTLKLIDFTFNENKMKLWNQLVQTFQNIENGSNEIDFELVTQKVRSFNETEYGKTIASNLVGKLSQSTNRHLIPTITNGFGWRWI